MDGFEEREKALVENQPRPGHTGQDAADNFPPRSTARRENHDQPVRPNGAAKRRLQRRLILVHDLARGHGETVGQEGLGDPPARLIAGPGEMARADAQDERTAH
jgi:hypothetical protein